MQSGRFGALKPRKLGLRYKANKCSGAGTGDLGVASVKTLILLLMCLGKEALEIALNALIETTGW